jgi:hypothetical protein
VTNDDWVNSPDRAQIEAAHLAPPDTRESAIIHTLTRGQYTAVVRGKNGATGIGVVEVYDLDATNNAKLANLSTRGFVDKGDNILIGGFIAGNRNGSINVLIRASGPSLPSTVPTRLADPTLELHNSNGTTIAINDEWQETQKPAIEQTTLQPSNPHESAILASLTPGGYTAIVRGANNSTGNALVEVYNIP